MFKHYIVLRKIQKMTFVVVADDRKDAIETAHYQASQDQIPYDVGDSCFETEQCMTELELKLYVREEKNN